MELDLAQQRQQAHSLIDGLPEEKLFAVSRLLELLVEPLPRSLENAPVEDEALTPETIAALTRACASIDRGESLRTKRFCASSAYDRGGRSGPPDWHLVARSSV